MVRRPQLECKVMGCTLLGRYSGRFRRGLFRRVEAWRERLLDDPSSLAQLLAEYPSADAARLRSLIEAARRERSGERPAHSARELFRALRALLENSDD